MTHTDFLLAAATASDPPAGGAEIAQVIGATAAAMVLTAALLIFGLGHRSGRIKFLANRARFAERVSGMPGWAAIPAGLAAPSLMLAAFGLYWDISLHIDNGRDPGPLANPSHYAILGGLFGIFAAGWLAIVLPEERPGRSAVRITRDWYAPVGGILLMASASFAMLGFPLDDVFHRFFGQDVTLWGPTHLMMLTGAALSLLGILALLAEARAIGREGSPNADAVSIPGVPHAVVAPIVWALTNRKVKLISACGGLLIAMSIYQGEFDYGVPQFRLLFHPILIALAAAFALVVARTVGGRGVALGATVFFLVFRGGLTLLVGPIFGEATSHFPLFLTEALLVEGVALAIGTQRAYRFGVVAGALIGSVGVLAEWGWSHVWMPIAWPGHIVGEAIALSVVVAIAAGVIGAFVGSALSLRRDVVDSPRAWGAVAAGFVAICAVVGILLPTTVPDGARGTVTLTEVKPPPNREVLATVRFDPPSAVRDADWLDEIAWQGGKPLIVAPLKRISDGVYRTSEPIPVYGGWKSGLRLHRGDVMASIPVFMPADDAIPVAGISAPARFDRAFVADHKILQRERKDDVPAGLFALAGLLVLAMAMTIFGGFGWGLVRIARSGSEDYQVERRAAAARPAAPWIPAGADS